MCLDIKTTQKRDEDGYPIPSIAKEDIVCYKQLEKEESYYITPYQRTVVKRGQVMKADLYFTQWSVYQGIHAFQTLTTAKKSVDWYNEVVVKCIIPKGAKYFRGKRGHIVASKMKLQKIVVKFVKDKKVILEEPLKKNKK